MAAPSRATNCFLKRELMIPMAKALDVVNDVAVDARRPPPLVAFLKARLPQFLGPFSQLDGRVLLHERAVGLQRRQLLLHRRGRHAFPHFLHHV
jgi:hypothetical protein